MQAVQISVPSVENMLSYNGNKVPNQFIIKTEQGRVFKSYDSIIAFVDKSGRVFLDSKYWDYSNTTRKYRNEFLGEKSKETAQKVASGVYVLTDLNSK